MAQINSKLWLKLFKGVIFIASYGFVSYRLFYDEHLRNVLFEADVATGNAYWLLLAAVLMPVNWALETGKWQILLKPTEWVSFSKAFGGVLAGLSVAIFTPNRTGEYAGRIWILKKRHRIAGIGVTVAGSIAQSGITFVAGIVAGCLWLANIEIKDITNPAQLGLAAAITVGGFIFYMLLPEIAAYFDQKKVNRIIHQLLRGIKRISRQLLAFTLIISFLRYAIFVFQFLCLLMYFETGMNFFEVFLGVAMLYAGMLVIPTVAIAEPGVRSSLSLIILGVFSTNGAGILAASLTLWIINLAIPALIGAVYLAILNTDKP